MTDKKTLAALKETARRNGVTLDELLRDMEQAIAAGLADPDPTARAFWQSVPRAGEVPTPVELVHYIAQMEALQQARAPKSDRCRTTGLFGRRKSLCGA